MKNDISIHFEGMVSDKRIRNTDIKAAFVFNIERAQPATLPVICKIRDDGRVVVDMEKKLQRGQSIKKKFYHFVAFTSPRILSRISKMWNDLIMKDIISSDMIKDIYATTLHQDDIYRLEQENVMFTLKVPSVPTKNIKEKNLKRLVGMFETSYYQNDEILENKYRTVYNMFKVLPTTKKEMNAINEMYHILTDNS